MEFETWAAIIGLIATVPVYKGWFLILIRKNKSRRIGSLKKQINHLTLLHSDSFYFTRWAAESIIVILTILSIAFMFEGVAFDPNGRSVSSIFISLMSALAYLVCVYKIRVFTDLKSFDKTLEQLNKKLSKLNA
tara:strand:+ start:354 stop:755 length:402 start_codon:yes stop_codon:yes gene_type:complete